MSQLRERAEQLFAQALSLPPDARTAFLAQACRNDPELLGRVEALLRGHAEAEFLESSAVADLEDKLIGTRIGRYKLLEKIGEGGSGAVYHAEQEEPIRRRVALKIIKAGMDTREVIARFEAERQILAVMDHPNIARVYDCGATETGRPYFVMELVQGTPITRYCDDRRLAVPERLELFVAVCRAIQHAHEKGIVHRDIKPNNVLVTLYDGIPSPKVIDFGVAKATEARLAGRTVFTSSAQFIGTPAYMSPEQADLGAVDARSDVYSLGVLLYELLTGFTPFDGSSLTSAGLEEMRRRMRQEAPPRPSQRLAAADPATQAAAADRRGLKPAELAALLRRDLDGIVMRCIERDSARRYPTAVALATHITAYLRHEPVAARPRTHRVRPVWRAAAASLLVLVAAGLFLWKPWNRPGAAPSATAEAGVEFPHDSDLKRAMKLIYGTDAIPEDFSLAEDIIREFLAHHPTDPEGVTAMAVTEDAFLDRGFDVSQARFTNARRFAEQAVRLAPRSPAALGALGVYLYRQPGGDLLRARELLQQAIALDPRNPVYYRYRDDALFADERMSTVDAITSAERTAALFPNDALSHYDLGRHYRDVGRLGDWERELDRTIALEPITNAIIWKARTALWVRGDVEEMRALLDRVPARGRSLERWALGTWIYAMASGKTKVGLDAIDALTENWSTDFDFVGPTPILKASLYEIQGQGELARLQYEAALTVVKAREMTDPASADNLCYEAWCLHGLGRTEEARAALDRYNQTLRRPYRTGFGRNWWFTAIPINFILGNRSLGLQLLREAAMAIPAGRGSIELKMENNVTRNGYGTDYHRQILIQDLRVDPRMAPWRNDPEVLAILAPPKSPTLAPALSTPPPPTDEASALIARVRKIYGNYNYGRADLALAEKLMARATDLAPDSAEAWALRGFVQATYVQRFWDLDTPRLQAAQNYCNQALALEPNETEAMLGLAIVLHHQAAYDQAESLMRRAVALRPSDPRLLRLLGVILNDTGRTQEGLAVFQDAVRRFPRDPLAWYDLGRDYLFLHRSEDAIAAMRQVIALRPLSGAYNFMALALLFKGDLAAAHAAMNQMPPESRTADRAVATAMWFGLIDRNLEEVEAAARLTTLDYFNDGVFRIPKAFFLAEAFHVAGKEALANQQWDETIRVLRQHLVHEENDTDRALLATALAWKGHLQEAAAEIAPVEATHGEISPSTHPDPAYVHTTVDLAYYYAAAGRADEAIKDLTWLLKDTRRLSPALLRLEPDWDKLRSDPRFQALAKAALTPSH